MPEFKEKKMANRKNWLGILVIVLVFGMTVVGCGDGSGGGTDPALNGTWSSTNEDGVELTFNNGNYESKANGTLMGKGTYTTSGNKMTSTGTHYMYGSKLCTKADLKALGIPDDQLNRMFAPQTGTYSISGNTLTMTGTNPETGETSTATLTKK